MRTEADRDTFAEYCKDVGMTLMEHLLASRCDHDLVRQPREDPVEKRTTADGDEGVFCTRPCSAGAVICLVVTKHKQRTIIAGRYINHSCKPTTAFLEETDGVKLVALRYLSTGSELTIDYRSIPSIRWDVYASGD